MPPRDGSRLADIHVSGVTTMHATRIAVTRPPPADSWRIFVRHLGEMVAAMLVGMAVLGAVVSLIFATVGHSNLLHYAGLRGLLMAGYMTVGMSLWMRYRRHSWTSIAEMGAAMFVPYVLLIGPFLAGAVSPEAFLAVTHLLMLPCMIIVMLHRRDEYAQHHALHSSHRSIALPRAFARFNRRVANPIVRQIAGRVPPFAIVSHAGRTSGRAYRTPVLAFAKDDALVVALIYGATSDWVRNVVAAGGAMITRFGRSRAYGRPQIAGRDEAATWVPRILRIPVRLFGIHVLRMNSSL